MKELSIEEKAERYNKAIDIARKINNERRAQPFNVMERVFPELKEDENEKIRKWLIALIKSNEYGAISNVGEMPCSKLNVIAWIENQGNQKFTWSEEDEANLNEALSYIKDDTLKEFIKSLKFRNQWKPNKTQIETLEYYMHTLLATEYKKVLFGLYNELKQLIK